MADVGITNTTKSSPELLNCSNGDHHSCLQAFKHILSKANDKTSTWDGELYFVYLPGIIHQSEAEDDNFRNLLLLAVNEAHIPIIDIQSDVFDLHPDPLSLFPFGLRGHYTPEGYRLVTEAILSKIHLDTTMSR